MMIVCHPIEQVKSLTMQKTYDLPFKTLIYTDTDDFDATIFNVTFDADERAPVTTLISTFIPIVDDDKDEANIQYFIVTLEIVDAINLNLISIGHAFTRGIIVDNDSEYNIQGSI